MSERKDFEVFRPREMTNTEAALKLAGQLAKKTVSLIFNEVKRYPVIGLGMGLVLASTLLVGAEQRPLAYIGLYAGIGLLFTGLITDFGPASRNEPRISLPNAIGKGISSLQERWSAYRTGN
jgi:hypothetical protein